MISFSNRHAHCMVVAGRTNELLKSWRTSIESVNTDEEIENLMKVFPRGGAFSVFSAAPEKISECIHFILLIILN